MVKCFYLQHVFSTVRNELNGQSEVFHLVRIHSV